MLPPQLVFADTPSRLMAYLLDGFVPAPIYYVLLGVLGIDVSRFGLDPFPDRTLYVIATLGALLANAAYFVWFWSGGRRATPGQRIFGIQVGNAFDGNPLTLGQAFGRWAALGQWITVPFLLPMLPAAIAATTAALIWAVALLLSTVRSATKQGLHDRFAGSAVVRPAGAGNRWAVGCLSLLLILVVVEALFFVWSISTPSPYLPPDYWDRFVRWMWPS